jgi:hypothetical protein
MVALGFGELSNAEEDLLLFVFWDSLGTRRIAPPRSFFLRAFAASRESLQTPFSHIASLSCAMLFGTRQETLAR